MEATRYIVKSGKSSYKEHNFINIIQIYIDWDVQYVNYTVTCSKCATINTVNHVYEMCNNCFEDFDQYNNMRRAVFGKLREFDFAVDGEEHEVPGYDRHTFVPVHFCNEQPIYGVIEFQVSYEYNEWNSAPHDNYDINLSVFMDEISRDTWFEERLKNEINV